MKQVKIMNLPECDKLLYCGGAIAQQIGTMFVVDDEAPTQALSYPILSGGRSMPQGSEDRPPGICQIREARHARGGAFHCLGTVSEPARV